MTTDTVRLPSRRVPLVEPGRPLPAGEEPPRPAGWRRLRVRGARARLLLAYVLLLSVSLLASVFVMRGVLVSGVETRVETGLRQEAQELQRLVGGNDPETGMPFDDDVRSIFDTFFRRNVPDDTEGLYAFVDGEPYLTNALPPAALTEDRRFVERVRGLREPWRGRLETPDFLDRGPVDVAALVRDVLVKVQPLGARDWQLDAVEPVTVHGDAQRLAQALLQLAANAVQHTGEGQVVALGVRRSGSDVLVWVRDEGEGVAPADRERVFDRFARAAASRRRSEGSGLGLSIVRAIAESHGGRVELATETGRGSTFTLVLPA